MYSEYKNSIITDILLEEQGEFYQYFHMYFYKNFLFKEI